MANERPRHPFFDPDQDGHNCVLCSSDSIWKCDVAAHPNDPYDWLTDEQRTQLRADLAAMAKARRAALDAAHMLPLSSIHSQPPGGES